MDEESKIENPECPWPVELINDEYSLIRSVFYMNRVKISKKRRRHPNDAAFLLRKGENGVSFTWDKYASPEQAATVWGLTKKDNSDFTDINEYKFFKIPVTILRQINGIKDILYDPEYFGNPSLENRPNNKAHSIITYTDPVDNLGARIDLSDYCDKNYESSACELHKDSMNKSLEELRQRIPETPYHKLWEF